MRKSVRGAVCPAVLAALALAPLGGCERRQPAPPAQAGAHYVLGMPWESDGYWFYPSEDLAYDASGLAVVDASGPDAARNRPILTADGERYDPDLLTASHQTLQLPVILHVRNLENGREILVRVNDRGPSSPGRLLSVTPRAARLLEMNPGHETRVRIWVDQQRSQDLLQSLQGAPRADIVAAPVGSVQELSLVGGSRQPEPAAAPDTERAPDAVLPENVTIGSPDPGQLWIDAGHFSQQSYARSLAAKLDGLVLREGRGRSIVYKIRVGPFSQPAEADAALDRARSAGVTGARIIVE